jgi:hypothetical protein
MSPVMYELGFYIPEHNILHSNCRENLKSYLALTGWTLYRRSNVSPVMYELGFYIPEDAILHSRSCENLKSYEFLNVIGVNFILQRVKTVTKTTKMAGLTVQNPPFVSTGIF